MISVRGLDFGYAHEKKILQSIAFDVENGACIAVLGNNGAGKSTMLKCLNKMISPQKGTVMVEEKNVLTLQRGEIAQQMAYVAQKSEGGRMTVFDGVLLGRKPYIKFSVTKEDEKITQEMIEKMGLEALSLRHFDELSGGEQQKVMLARALNQQPKVLLLDEPTSNLDLKNQLEVLGLVRKIAKEQQIAVIIVIHDLNLALRYCDKYLFLKDNEIYVYGGMEVMTPKNIEFVYDVPVEIGVLNGRHIVVPSI